MKEGKTSASAALGIDGHKLKNKYHLKFLSGVKQLRTNSSKLFLTAIRLFLTSRLLKDSFPLLPKSSFLLPDFFLALHDCSQTFLLPGVPAQLCLSATV